MTRRISLLLVLCSLQACLAASKCYYPNGVEAEDFPCDPGADESVCCGGGLGSVCLSNKLCLGADGNTVRGSCTDKNWASAECAMYCLGANTGGTDLVSCSNVTNSDTSYCCDHNPNCCNSGVGRFNVLPPEPEAWATWNRRATQYAVVGTLFDSEPTSTTAPPTTTSMPSTTTTTSAPPSPTTVEASSTNDSAADTERSSAEPSGLSTGAKAGIGAGVGVGALVIAAVVYLLWKTRKNDRAAKENKQSPPDYHGPQMDSAWKQPHSMYVPQEPQHPQELHGHQIQGYSVRAELPAHN
ncbi:hypothetical protein ACJ41O_012017 [Fusarium nematophilum]